MNTNEMSAALLYLPFRSLSSTFCENFFGSSFFGKFYLEERSFNMTFNEKLAKARRDKGYTQAQLAKEVEVSTRCIQNYELGTRYPKRDILSKICKILKVRQEYLVSEDDFFGLVEAEDGLTGVESARRLLDCAGALFAGGDISEEDKDKVMLALQNIYWKSKEKHMKKG